MYFSKIILENFQAFEKGEFNLSPNLNILVGVSNVGKSSVARALSLVLFNTWDKSWCKFGTKYCRITLQTNSGIEVIREKGEKVNRYILRLSDQPEQLFESFGTGVPEQVQQALHIHEVQVDTTDKLNLNLAGQMDPLFLLSQTGSYRAKVLGKLSGATYLDHAIRELNKDKRQVTAEKNLKDLEIVELQTQVDKLVPIESYADIINALESQLSSLAVAQERVERIRELFKRVSLLKRAWIAETEKQALLVNFDPKSIEQLIQRVDKIKLVSLFSNRMVHNNLSFMQQRKLQSLLNNVDLLAINVLAEKSINFKKLKDFFVRFNQNKKERISKTDELEQAKQKYIEVKEQYSVILKQNGTCPLCNQSTLENVYE